MVPLDLALPRVVTSLSFGVMVCHEHLETACELTVSSELHDVGTHFQKLSPWTSKSGCADPNKFRAGNYGDDFANEVMACAMG